MHIENKMWVKWNVYDIFTLYLFFDCVAHTVACSGPSRGLVMWHVLTGCPLLSLRVSSRLLMHILQVWFWGFLGLTKRCQQNGSGQLGLTAFLQWPLKCWSPGISWGYQPGHWEYNGSVERVTPDSVIIVPLWRGCENGHCDSHLTSTINCRMCLNFGDVIMGINGWINTETGEYVYCLTPLRCSGWAAGLAGSFSLRDLPLPFPQLGLQCVLCGVFWAHGAYWGNCAHHFGFSSGNRC